MPIFQDSKHMTPNPNFNVEEVILLCKKCIESCDEKIKSAVVTENFNIAHDHRTVKTSYEAFLLLLTDPDIYDDILHLWGIK